jgi:hypothetical protein
MPPPRKTVQNAAMSKTLLERLRALVGRDRDWEHGADPADGSVDARRAASEETFEGRKDDAEIDEYFPGARDDV